MYVLGSSETVPRLAAVLCAASISTWNVRHVFESCFSRHASVLRKGPHRQYCAKSHHWNSNLGNNLPAWIDGRGTLQYGTSALPRIERIWDKDRQTSQILEFLFRPCVTTLARTMCWTAGFSPLHITMYSPQFWMTGDTVFWCKTSHVSNKQVDIRWDVVQSQNETRPKWRQMNLTCNMPPTIIQPFRLVVTNSKNIPLTSLATVDSRHSFLPLQTHQALIGSCCQNQARTGHVQAMNKPKAIVEVV